MTRIQTTFGLAALIIGTALLPCQTLQAQRKPFRAASAKITQSESASPRATNSSPVASPARFTDDEIKKYCDELCSTDFQKRELASQKLSSAGFGIVPQLCDLIVSGGPEQRFRATRILVAIGFDSDEVQVGKLTRVLHLLGSHGHPSLLTKAYLARHTWKQHQINKTVNRIKRLGGQVVGSNVYAEANPFDNGTGQRGPANGRKGRPGTGNFKPQKLFSILPYNIVDFLITTQPAPPPRPTADVIREKIAAILADDAKADTKALRALNLAGSTNQINRNLPAVDAQALNRALATSSSYQKGLSVTLAKNWMGNIDDFKSLLDLPLVYAIQMEEIKVTNEMMDVVDQLSVRNVQLIKCEFDSARVREYARKHPNLYLNVRGKALLGVKGPIAGTSTVNNNSRNEASCEITEVINNSAAADAGIRVGDVIQAVDEHEVSTFQELVFEIAGRKIGTTVKLKILRHDETKYLELKLGDSSDPKVNVDD